MLARRALGALLGLLVRAWLASLRLTLVVDPALAATRPRRPFALAFWHGQQFALLRWARFQRMVALVSRSRDGELVAAALARLGIASARGSSSRGGAAGLKAIVRRLRDGCDAAFAVDGPRGPARVVRSESGNVGAALSARLAGGVVVPMAAACARPHVFAKAWDRFELPLPFTRVAVALGPPIEPGEATPERLAAAIDRASEVAETAVRGVGMADQGARA
ncbi:MAG: lysophospholipid acyltransferase family protein [Minicystis sp.]